LECILIIIIDLITISTLY